MAAGNRRPSSGSIKPGSLSKAESRHAAFNVNVNVNINIKDKGLSYGIALRNGVIAITEQHNDGPTIELTGHHSCRLSIDRKPPTPSTQRVLRSVLS